MTPTQRQAVAIFKRVGTIAGAARELGMTNRGLQRLLDRAGVTADVRKEHKIDPAIQKSMDAVGTGMVPALAWAKIPPRDGETGYSVLLKPEQEQPEAVADRIRAALEGMEPAPIAEPPTSVMADLCTIYPLMDAHIGMRAWSAETGSHDYDLTHAASDMRHAFGKVLALTPPSGQAVLIVGGDYLHADDNNAETPASRHKLDVDGRFYKVLDVGIHILAEIIDSILRKHEHLVIRVLRGNHDPHACLTITFALAERYRNEPRVTVEKDPRDIFMMQWGNCAIFAHHGDKGKPQQMALYLSDVCPFWSATRHRHYLTGHVHHDHAKDLGPLRYESLRAFCPPDAYAAGMGYGGRRALQSMTFHKADGLVLRALDPIDRAP